MTILFIMAEWTKYIQSLIHKVAIKAILCSQPSDKSTQKKGELI
jgi:hypothetical protein